MEMECIDCHKLKEMVTESWIMTNVSGVHFGRCKECYNRLEELKKIRCPNCSHDISDFVYSQLD